MQCRLDVRPVIGLSLTWIASGLITTGSAAGQAAAVPNRSPELFAPGIVSPGHLEHSAPTISPPGDEMYWSAFHFGLGPEVIFVSRLADGEWTPPGVGEIQSISDLW